MRGCAISLMNANGEYVDAWDEWDARGCGIKIGIMML